MNRFLKSPAAIVTAAAFLIFSAVPAAAVPKAAGLYDSSGHLLWACGSGCSGSTVGLPAGEISFTGSNGSMLLLPDGSFIVDAPGD